MNKTSLYAEAYKYLEVWNFSIIPVGKDKRPLIVSWKKYQTTKPTISEIERWWQQWPDANIGIVTGKISGITVVDVDIHKGANVAPFPETYTVQTGNGGLQLYYAYEQGFTVSADGYDNLPHVDIRGDGGYVVAPPSVTDYLEKGIRKGGRYTVEKGGEFEKFPLKLFPRNPTRKINKLIGVSSGSRNNSMASVIGTLLLPMQEDKFMSDGWEAVVAINKTYNPPLPDKELETTFKSIVKKEQERRANSNQATPSPIQITPTERIDILLRKNSNNVPYKDMTNAILVLSQHPHTSGKIKYNEFRQEIEFNKKPVEESDLLDFVYLLQNSGLPTISKDTVQSALQRYAFENKYDEAIDYLKSLTWDKVPRLATWLIKATHVEDDEHGYHQGIGAQWFRGLVNRLINPGCIFDYVLVMIGPQGVGKTSLFRILGGQWYKSFTGAVENKDFYLQLRGAAILDLDEGVALYRSESIKMKSIITQTTDEYRAPYDRMTKKYPRRFAFSMSTNDAEPFRDVTGNRRYWPVETRKLIDFKWLEENRDQLYAEAYYVIMNNIALPELPLAYMEERQENYLQHDEWEEPIGNWLRKSYDFLIGSVHFQTTIAEIYEKVLLGDKLERLERKHEMRIGTILKKNGLERRKMMVDGIRKYRYVLTNETVIERKQYPLIESKEKFDEKMNKEISEQKKQHDDDF